MVALGAEFFHELDLGWGFASTLRPRCPLKTITVRLSGPVEMACARRVDAGASSIAKKNKKELRGKKKMERKKRKMSTSPPPYTYINKFIYIYYY